MNIIVLLVMMATVGETPAMLMLGQFDTLDDCLRAVKRLEKDVGKDDTKQLGCLQVLKRDGKGIAI